MSRYSDMECMTPPWGAFPIFMPHAVVRRCNYGKATFEETEVTPVSSLASTISVSVRTAVRVWSSSRGWTQTAMSTRPVESDCDTQRDKGFNLNPAAYQMGHQLGYTPAVASTASRHASLEVNQRVGKR